MTKKFKFLKKAPKEGQTVFLLTPEDSNSFYLQILWTGEAHSYNWLSERRIYLTKRDVKRAAKFIKNFIKSHKEQLNYITSEPEPETEVWYGLDMDGSVDDPRSFVFNPMNANHQSLLKLGLLYNSSDMVQKASKIITKALAMEYKRFKYKFLTEVPEPGSIVYYPHCGVESGVEGWEYDPDAPEFVRYLKLGLLFSKKKHALRAGRAMLKQINPLGSKRLKLTKQWTLLTNEGDHD
ncbi:hypothetical protein [Snodgrassella sp. ESL0324]|uniref:hypothetical protein n=1 Tax=Snodgrassella sp. ESL0324 TaxID=2705033 RepID=UPI00158317F8|nr:hypothetical protein [Snodgrassella sp. ESL0324]NUF08916.1 hypothetical protein [Snodgrassella sp. ESL0324]